MGRVTLEIGEDLAREIERIVRDGWFRDQETLIQEALRQFVGAKTYLGDSPRMLRRFAADALNESKPDTALKFVDRALSLLAANKYSDLGLYQAVIELKVQILLVTDRFAEASHTLEEARERLPNSPSIGMWIERVQSRAKQVEKDTAERQS